MDHDFFVSFGSEAIEEARKIYRHLKRYRGTAFFAEENILPAGASDAQLEYALGAALDSSAALVVLWGRAHVGSKWCAWEVKRFCASRPGRPIYVIALDASEVPLGFFPSGATRFLRRRSQIFDARVTPLPPKETQGPTAAWGVPIFMLLAQPRAWRKASAAPLASFSAIEIVQDASLETSQENLRIRLLKWAASTLAGSIAVNVGCLVMAWLAGLAGHLDCQSLLRDLFLVTTVTLSGGLILALGYGLGAGAAGIAIGGAVGYFAVLIDRFVLGEGGGGAAAAAGALIAAAAAYRIHLDPMTGVETPHPPRLPVQSALMFCVGVLAASGLLRAGIVMRQRMLETLLSREWSDTSVGLRAALSAALGLAAGSGCALSVRQRLSFRIRPRDERRKGWYSSLGLLLTCGVLGALAGVLDAKPHSGGEVVAVGLVVAFLMLSTYLLPIVFTGLRKTEGGKAMLGFLGTLFTLGLGEHYLNAFPGIDDYRLPLQQTSTGLGLGFASWLGVFLFVASVGTFAALMMAEQVVQYVKENQMTGFVFATAASLLIHGGLMALVPRADVGRSSGIAEKRDTIQVTVGRAGSMSSVGLAKALGAYRQTLSLLQKKAGRPSSANHPSVVPRDLGVSRRTVLPLTASGGATRSRSDAGPPADSQRLAGLHGTVRGDWCANEPCGAEGGVGGLPLVSVLGKGFRVVLPPGFKMTINGWISAGANVAAYLQSNGRPRELIVGCRGDCKHVLIKEAEAVGRVFEIVVESIGGPKCRVTGPLRAPTAACEDGQDDDFNEPELKFVFLDQWAH